MPVGEKQQSVTTIAGASQLLGTRTCLGCPDGFPLGPVTSTLTRAPYAAKLERNE